MFRIAPIRPAAVAGSNPADRIQWTAAGEHLKAFFACLCYAALRPSEGVMLREDDLHLPTTGWGQIVLSASASRAGRVWTHGGAVSPREPGS